MKVIDSSESAKVKWLKVDNAGKIYPAARRSDWTALFRVSATLNEKIYPEILDQAQRITLKRFPQFALKLKSGLFWPYLEIIHDSPELQEDVANPCVRMDLSENKGFMLRVRYYNKTIALEVFHVLSDGTGGMSFLLTMVAEYLRLKYGADIPRNKEILDCTEEPKQTEIEDAFVRFAGPVTRSRKEPDSYYIKGTREPMDRIHVTSGVVPVNEILSRAKEKQVSLTEYLVAVMIMAVNKIQLDSFKGKSFEKVRKKLKPIKVSVPVNLRKFYPTNTKRNFASYVNVGIDPRLGVYTFNEVLKAVHHQMGLEVNEKSLNAKFSTNVLAEKNNLLSITPLFIKNIALRIVFNMVGDRKTSTVISNLGNIVLPDEMQKYVDRIDFLVGPLSRNRITCAVASYKGNLVINFIRTIKESMLEREFFTFLVKQGVHVKISSNSGY